jgi:hypothetical protein
MKAMICPVCQSEMIELSDGFVCMARSTRNPLGFCGEQIIKNNACTHTDAGVSYEHKEEGI